MATGQNRIRGKEASMVIYLDGARLLGDFVTVKSFTITPDRDLRSEQFIGEKRARNDQVIRGYDANFTIQLFNHAFGEIMDRLNRLERLGLPNPDIQVVLLMAYREAPFRQLTMDDEVILGVPTIEVNEDDYVTAGWDVRAREMATL